MFIDFQFGNFRSFRDVQKFSMQAASLHANDGGLEEGNVFTSSNVRLLKSKAIYGANASGKSNFAKAFSVFLSVIAKSVQDEEITKQAWEERFKLITKWDEQPIFFQFIFLKKSNVYRYGFQLLNGKILYEWLFENNGKKEVEHFMRNGNDLQLNASIYKGPGAFMQQALQSDNEIFRADSLFLTAAAIQGIKLIAELRKAILEVAITGGIYGDFSKDFAMRYMNIAKGEEKEKLIDLIKSADIGLEDLEIAEVLDENIRNEYFGEKIDPSKAKLTELRAKHSVYNEKGSKSGFANVSFGEWESEGTAKLFGLGAVVIERLLTGRVLIVDEFDARLHPNLTLKIVEIFHNKETNPKNAQLIFVTHDTGLLRRADLRRDQICFVNKDKFGVSTMRTLIEFKGVRKDASYEKEYLNGNYSAIPFLDQMENALLKTYE